MASTLTPELSLFKPTPGTAEPFRSTDVNSNWDKVDTALTVAQLTAKVQTIVTTGITINGGTA
jgi:hypothetical protein